MANYENNANLTNISSQSEISHPVEEVNLIVKWEPTDPDNPIRIYKIGTTPSKNIKQEDMATVLLPLNDDDKLEKQYGTKFSMPNKRKKANEEAPKNSKRQTQNRQENEGCLFRSLNNIHTLPRFIDGDGFIKFVNINTDDTSKNKQRFGDPNKIDKVILGLNGTTVLKSDLNRLNWSAKPSACLRILLSLVFHPIVLGLSSLSGKKSKRFQGLDKPEKTQLDRKKVADIMEFIMEQLPISAREARKAISLRCGECCRAQYRFRIRE